MNPALAYSVFHGVLFPAKEESADDAAAGIDLRLQRLVRFQPQLTMNLADIDLVVFDFETTGLDSRADRIVEIGAMRFRKGECIKEYTTLVRPDVVMLESAVKVTGITAEMLAEAPVIDSVLPNFLAFFDGAILVAYNAEFDVSFLNAACQRMGIDLQWPAFCTLKMARALLPELENKTLDKLAEHFGLSFEARHRSLGDVKVTSEVMKNLLHDEGLDTWQQLAPYWII